MLSSGRKVTQALILFPHLVNDKGICYNQIKAQGPVLAQLGIHPPVKCWLVFPCWSFRHCFILIHHYPIHCATAMTKQDTINTSSVFMLQALTLTHHLAHRVKFLD
jgi:hypothetical protein